MAVSMLFLGLSLLGIASLARMPVAFLPDVAVPRLVVRTDLAEAGPAEVERFLTEPVEEALSAVPDVRRIESVSREGMSVVTLDFPWGTDMEFARLHARERLDDAAGRLPRGADRPTILRVDPGSEPILVASATADERFAGDLGVLVETVFRRRLEQIDGVGRVVVVGGVDRAIVVEVDADRLAAHGVGIDAVGKALSEANAAAPGGTVRHGRYRYAFRALGEFSTVEEIATTVVGRATGGGTITVADVGVVRDTVAGRESAAFLDGRPSVGLLVHREGDANTVAAAGRAVATLEAMEAEHPGIDFAVVADRAGFVVSSIRGVVGALAVGAALAFLVLLPFLRDPRWPVAIATAIPTSILTAFAFLHAAGVSLNVMSLGGLSLGVGMLVDNSIVVLENVFRHRERGVSPAAAAVVGAREVQAAITASTLTTIAVFLPVLYVEGLAGALFEDLALAVAFSLLASLLVATTLLPAVAARFGDGGPGTRRGRAALRAGRGLRPGPDAIDRAFDRVAAGYERVLSRALDRRGAVLGWTAVALGAALPVALLLPRNVLPEVEPRAFTARIALPPATPLERTEALALEIDGWLREQDGVAAVLARVGRASEGEAGSAFAPGRNAATLDVRLERDGPAAREVAAALRDRFAALAPGVLTVEDGSAADVGRVLGTAGSDVRVRARGRDPAALRAAAERVEARLLGLPELADVQRVRDTGRPEVAIGMDREAIARHGLGVREVVDALLDRTRGREATGFADFDREVPVVVRPEASVRRDLDRVLDAEVRGVPLRLLVDVRETTAPASVLREDREPLVAVTADVARGGLDGAIDAVESALEGLPLPDGVALAIDGGVAEVDRSLRSLGFAFLLALLLVYLILAAQFESLVLPAVALLSVPFAVVGAVSALAVTGQGLDTMSGIGIVVLVGIAVNDAIVKVDTIERTRARSEDLRVAIEEAGRTRPRPIVMTTATTILGLLPLAIGIGGGADLRRPLAIAGIGGMATSTALTLLVLPVAYAAVAGRRGERARSVERG